MSMGERIRRVRRLRGMTQRELGMALGFETNTADVRIAQYEAGTRKPKSALLESMAEVLDVERHSLEEPTVNSDREIMYALFELDERCPIAISETESPDGEDDAHFAIDLMDNVPDRYLREWAQRKRELAQGEITMAEYREWKLNWPRTAEAVGKHMSRKPWRRDDGR